MELLAGTRGLDMIKNNQGETVYLIGNFITFESADEYVSLLIRNGYSTARVAAYVGHAGDTRRSCKGTVKRTLNDKRSTLPVGQNEGAGRGEIPAAYK